MQRNKTIPDVTIVLHNIRSAHNVGSIFRSADAFGAGLVICSGYTPTPVDRFGRVRRDITKTALGAEQTIAWKRVTGIGRALDGFKDEGRALVAVEQDERAVDYRTLAIEVPAVFIFGNEVRGLSRSIRERADRVAQIPMRGSKESLNVSVAAGIILARRDEMLIR